MKTVSGTVVSSKPMSLSKSTSILSTFVSTDTGASQAMSAYLRRSLASCKELKQLHKDLKIKKSERKKKRRRAADDEGEANVGESVALVLDPTQEEVRHESEPKFKKQRR